MCYLLILDIGTTHTFNVFFLKEIFSDQTIRRILKSQNENIIIIFVLPLSLKLKRIGEMLLS